MTREKQPFNEHELWARLQVEADLGAKALPQLVEVQPIEAEETPELQVAA